MAASAAAVHHAEELADELSHLPASPAGVPGAAAPTAEQISRCLVYCRLRPSKPQDFEDDAFQLISMSGPKVIVKDERNYEYDGTFDGDSKQEDIFERVARPALEHATNGFCSALLAYGQTGTGKSFTMCCTKPGIEGIIPRSAQWIFEKTAADTTRKYEIKAQFVQIYRDNLGDLMVEGGKDKVDIRFEKTEGVTLPGCTSTVLNSPNEFMEYYNEGDKRRVVTATAMNPESSRGHTALVVNISSQPTDADDCGARVSGKVTFIDLAGYERFSKTGISNANAIMKDEAKTINASLLSLGHVVSSLSNNDKHIPWRNSKLTRLLQDSIGGNSRTTIILTVGPSSDHLHETTNSLQFGMRAMAVKVQAKISAHVDYEKLAAKLQLLLNEKDKQISSLELQLASNEAERKELAERHSRDEDDLRRRQRDELQRMQEEGVSAERIVEASKIFEVEIENLKEQQREEIEYQTEQNEAELQVLLEEQAKLTRRKEDEARTREESRLKELEDKLAQARGGDSTADLERCLKQLAERDAVLVSRAGERARLQALCATLIQQVKQLGGTPTHGGEFEENFVDIVQVEEIKSMLEMQVEASQSQVSDLRVQLSKIQEVASERANEVEDLRHQIDTGAGGGGAGAGGDGAATEPPQAEGDKSQQQDVAAATAAASAEQQQEASEQKEGAADAAEGGSSTNTEDGGASAAVPSPGSLATTTTYGSMRAGTTNLVDKSEVDTIRTLMQVDIDMLNTKVKMLETQLAQAGGAASGGAGGGGFTLEDSFIPNSSFVGNTSFGSMPSVDNNDSPSSASAGRGRRRANTIRLGGDAAGSGSAATAASGGGGGGGASKPADPQQAAKQLLETKTKLLSIESANVALNSHVKYLEQLVSDLGGLASPAPPQETTATIENVMQTASDLSMAKNEEIDRLMSLLDARESVVNDQAMQIANLSEDSRRVREQLVQNGITAPATTTSDGSSAAAAGPSMQAAAQSNANTTKQFVELVRAARTAQRTAEEKLYALQQRQAAIKLSSILENTTDSIGSNDLIPSNLSATRNHEADGDDGLGSGLPSPSQPSGGAAAASSHKHHHADAMSVDSLMSPKYAPQQIQSALPELVASLKQNDDKLLEAEARIIDLDAQNAALKRMVAALEKQLELAQMTPVCGLSKEDRDVIDLEHAKDAEAMREAQEEMQAQLQKQLEEKAKVEKMLEDMNKQRAREAAVYSSMEDQLQEQRNAVATKVEEDRKASQQEMHRLQDLAAEHEAEAKRLKAALEERDRQEAERAAEAERVKQQLDEAAKQQQAKADEAEKLRQELEQRDKAASDKDTEAEKLKKQLEENTRAMMAEQAKKQLADLGGGEEKKPGFFDRLKNWKL